MHAPRLALMLAALLLAGCAEPVDEAEAVGAPQEPEGPVTGGATGPGTFVVEALRVEDQHGDVRLHEDDNATVRFTLRHPGEPDEEFSRFVSLLVGGEVVAVENIRLAPGASKELAHEVGPVRGLERLEAEVRVAPAQARTEAEVLTWARTGEDVTVGDLTLRVNRWLKNVTEEGAHRGYDVNMTLSRALDGDAAIDDLDASVLCTDAEGVVGVVGEADPTLPEAGASVRTELHLPACPDMLYGVRFTGELAGAPFEERILFVERGWQPPATVA